MSRWLVDGEPGALVAPDDRGLLYGDGLFETIAFHRGRSALWPLHMARLTEGCLRLALPQPDTDLLAAECRELLGGGSSAVIRISLTRGRGGRAYFPPDQPAPRRILMLRDMPDNIDSQRRDGLVMRTSSVRLDRNSLGGLKHLSRLEQVLIAEECGRLHADEALVLDSGGLIVEGLAGNIVVVRDDRLIAPGPHPAAVAGVGLAWLRHRADAALEERPMAASELTGEDALWVINSVRGPCPVRALDGRTVARDGQIAQWQRLWRKEVEE